MANLPITNVCGWARTRWLPLALLLLGGLGATMLTGGAPTKITLNDLWEDTAATKNLGYQFRIYKHKELPSHLYEQLRIYFVYPAGARPEERRPAVVFIHGGGWGAGNPDQWFPQCRYFALRGLVGASIGYRLKSETTSIADCVTDCKSAIRYLRGHAAELGIDAKKIVVVGESAGGHLAAALGTIAGFDEPGEDLTISSKPDALILLNPITDMKTSWGKSLPHPAALALSPLDHVSAGTPPTLLLHGDADTVVDIEHSRAFLAKVVAAGGSAKLVVVPGAKHAFAIFKYGPEAFNIRAINEIDEYLVGLGYLQGPAILEDATVKPAP